MAPASGGGSGGSFAARQQHSDQRSRMRSVSEASFGGSPSGRSSASSSRGGFARSRARRSSAGSSPARSSKCEDGASPSYNPLMTSDGKVAGVDAPGPGDHTMGYSGAWPHFQATSWDLGRGGPSESTLAHRPPSQYGVPHRHHHHSMNVFPPRNLQGTKTVVLPGQDEETRHKTMRMPIPSSSTPTLRVTPGNFGAGFTILKPGTKENPVRIKVGEDTGQQLPRTPPIEREGDHSRGFKGAEPHFASTLSQLGRDPRRDNPQWGVPDKYHHTSMPIFPTVQHKKSVPNLPMKSEGDYSRGFMGPRPEFWSTSWDFGNDPNYAHTRKRYDFTPVAEKGYRFAMARDGAPGSCN
eukprot:TRINITY_DN61946_c0_g1_i1.p1 TRINITY_DN61946_c0_g1~~TRINITY_DN61946_c0_g1_i1.p1  ORF type:complete len:353 (+),score=41.07 TRINITY_DN61946_c0_g1_i1:44-1102(+)